MSGTKVTGVLRELRIHLCQTSATSKGIRDFVTTNYVSLKKSNPNLPILIRECKGIQPRIWARYDRGHERSVPLTNMGSGDIMNTVKQLMK